MIKTIGIFAQERDFAGRVFNNLSLDYIRAIEASGALAIIIPIFTAHLERYIDQCDGFVFPGGNDIDPELYGQEKNGARNILSTYDRYLYNAMDQITQTQKPILGICKWMQLINVYHGGTLKQDITENTFHFQPERWYECIDTAVFCEDSFLSRIFAIDKKMMNSIHHQAVDTIGKGIQISAVSEYDGEVEAIEHMHLPHYWVQWHPEYLGEHRRIFEWFVWSH